MPAQRPRASFEPISPFLDVPTLVEETENFQYVDRISSDMVEAQGVENFEKLVLLHVIIGGKPLVIDGYDRKLDPWTFTPQWLRDNVGDKVENARNLTNKSNLPLTIGHYLKNMGLLTDQYFEKPNNYREKDRQRIYLKDIDCPTVWQEKLKERIPASLFYLNENTTDSEITEPTDAVEANGRRRVKAVVRAGDLMSSLPPEMRAENLMCYIGHEGTYTPAHREMCATLGHNIMVEASAAVGEDGKPERPGSSIWFMTESKDRHMVSEYWLSVLGHDIEVENHFAQVVAWKKAPFKTYVVEQRPGDFIIIPPLAPHQVWNRGTRTMKVAWNRTTVETLELAHAEALPRARMVCRDEQYKCKAIVHFTLLKYSALLRSAKAESEHAADYTSSGLRMGAKSRQLQKDFRRLLAMFTSTLLSEMFSSDFPPEKVEYLPFDGNVTCSYCRGNIFNRFLSCPSCNDMFGAGTDEPYDICMECYVMGRSCRCRSNLKWVEQFKWKELVRHYDEWRAQMADFDISPNDKIYYPLQEERRLSTKKTLAHICQEQLRLRPWVDIKNPQPAEPEDAEEEEILVNDDGSVKKTIKKKSKAYVKTHKSCHVCFHRHPTWKMAACTKCHLWWCYGSLWRAHEILPRTIMEDPEWECPHCRKVCNTGACRKDPKQIPYEPQGTLLGHDTKKVADIRSEESLVDFSVSNLSWLREDMDTPHASSRLLRRREEAELAKLDDPTLDEHYVDESEVIRTEDSILRMPHTADRGFSTMVDPQLTGVAAEPYNSGRDGLLDPLSVDAPQNGQNEEVLPPVSTILQRLDKSGAPVHRLNQQDSVIMHDDSYTYPDPDIGNERSTVTQAKPNHRNVLGEGQILLSSGKKRATLSKRTKTGTQPMSGASLDYLKEQDKKRLEEAKKAGTLIKTYAALKGKSKIVTLLVGKENLLKVRNRLSALQPANSTSNIDSNVATQSSKNVLIQSDVIDNGPIDTSLAQGIKTKGPTAFRYRVEDDDDFGARKDRKKQGINAGPGKIKRRFEEITVASDEEDSDNNDDETSQRVGNTHRRSLWLMRKNGLEEDIPSELPSNWRDSKAASRGQRFYGTLNAQIRPRTDGGRPGRSRKHPIEEPASHQRAKGVVATSTAENQRAKLAAMQWAKGEADTMVDSFRPDNAVAQHALVDPSHSGRSIYSRLRQNGSKIRIVSAAVGRNISPSDPGLRSPLARGSLRAVTSTTANGRATANIETDSDTDSEDEIPARLIQPR